MIMINIRCTCCQHYTQRKQYETGKKVEPRESRWIWKHRSRTLPAGGFNPLETCFKKMFQDQISPSPLPSSPSSSAVRALDPACNRRLQCQGPHINLEESRDHQIYEAYSNVGTTIINHPIWEWSMPPIQKFGDLGMVYDCFTHICRNHNIKTNQQSRMSYQ